MFVLNNSLAVLYSTYITNGRYNNYNQLKLDFLNILRLDLSENQMMEFRKNQNKEINTNIKISSNRYRNDNAKLSKIAFISRDFHERRPSGQLTLKFFKLIKEINPNIEIFFYMYTNSPLSDTFRAYASPVLNQDINLVKLDIEKRQIDIIIDMQGHMHNNFNKIFNYRLAPIQMHWLGYPGTLGIKTIDYLVADETIVPKESQPHYVEKMAYMPRCYQCNNDDLLVTTSNLKRSDFNIPDDAFAFCHFNHEYKLDRKTWFVWMSILKRVPNSVLVFTVFDLNLLELLLNDAKINDVDLKQLIFVSYEKNREKHFNRINLCNLGLDCYRLNGHTSSSDLIASGIPLITYTSETYHNRVAKSILKAVDLEELVCYSFEEYANLAVRLATNKHYYDSVRKKVIENRTKYLFNTKLYVENFMNMLHHIWDEKLNKVENNDKAIEEPKNKNNEEQIKLEVEEIEEVKVEVEVEDVEEVVEVEKECDINQLQIINSNYNLPVINLVYEAKNNVIFHKYLYKLIDYVFKQYYLNVHLIIVIDCETINLSNLSFFNNCNNVLNNIVTVHTEVPDVENKLTITNEKFAEIINDKFYIHKQSQIIELKPIIYYSYDIHKANISELIEKYYKTNEIFNSDKIVTSNFEYLPKIYWINLERSKNRCDHMTKLLETYDLDNERVDAHDYLNFDTFAINNIDEQINSKFYNKRKQIEDLYSSMNLNGKCNDKNIDVSQIFNMFAKDNIIKINKACKKQIEHKQKELSCFSSHLKAMKIFLETSNDDYCIIAEDDLSFDYNKFWNKTYWEFFENLPDDWECVQLTQIIPIQAIKKNIIYKNRFEPTKYKDNFSWSTTAYMINRKGAQKVLDMINVIDNKYYFKKLSDCIADVFIYKYLISYTIPLFTYLCEDDSAINNNFSHLSSSKKIIDNLWFNYYENNNITQKEKDEAEKIELWNIFDKEKEEKEEKEENK